MNDLRQCVATATRMVSHSCRIQEFLAGKVQDFPRQEVLDTVAFTREGVLADATHYPVLTSVYAVNPMLEDYADLVVTAASADNNDVLMELVSALFVEFDADLERAEFWVSSYFILKAQEEKQPELCERIREAFRVVKAERKEHGADLVTWLGARVEPVLNRA